MKQTFKFEINGAIKEVSCAGERLLIDVIREDLRLTGTKRGCGIGVCGTCTVLIDGKPMHACRIKIKDVVRDSSLVARDSLSVARDDIASDERRATSDSLNVPHITTIEGLEREGKLHPIQQAFIDCGAIQCGFCTPGMVLTAKALLDSNPKPARDEIKKALAGNLCRCTGYQQIFEAVEEAAKRMAAAR